MIWRQNGSRAVLCVSYDTALCLWLFRCELPLWVIIQISILIMYLCWFLLLFKCNLWRKPQRSSPLTGTPPQHVARINNGRWIIALDRWPCLSGDQMWRGGFIIKAQLRFKDCNLTFVYTVHLTCCTNRDLLSAEVKRKLGLLIKYQILIEKIVKKNEIKMKVSSVVLTQVGLPYFLGLTTVDGFTYLIWRSSYLSGLWVLSQ